jgi:hypothetical protein
MASASATCSVLFHRHRRTVGTAPAGRNASSGVTLRVAVAHYLFTFVDGDSARERAAGFLRVGMWGVAAGEPHRDALAAGDLVLIYLGAPDRELIGRAELASAVRDWTPSEARVYPGDSPSGVSLAQVEEWDPPVPMNAVLSQLDRPDTARADFERGVVRISANEFETALAVAATDLRGRGT